MHISNKEIRTKTSHIRKRQQFYRISPLPGFLNPGPRSVLLTKMIIIKSFSLTSLCLQIEVKNPDVDITGEKFLYDPSQATTIFGLQQSQLLITVIEALTP